MSCLALQYFSTLSQKGMIFKKVIAYKMCVLILFTTFVWNMSHSLKNWERYDHKHILVFMYSTHYSCQSVMKLEFSRQVFEKYSNIKFHENLSSGSRVIPCRQTDSQPDTWTDMIKLTVTFRNFAIAPKNYKNIRLINKYKKVYSQHNNTTLFLVWGCQIFVENSDFHTFR